MYITLNHLLQDLTDNKPRTSSVLFKDKLAHIVYTQFDNYLLLLMLPDMCVTIKEVLQMNQELIRYLEFIFESVNRCFIQDVKQLDSLLLRYLYFGNKIL